MAKRFIYFAALAAFLFSFKLLPACAEDGSRELWSKIDEIRYKASDAIAGYKAEQEKIKQAIDIELAALKKEFHKKRAQYIEEKKAALQSAQEFFDKQMRLLKQQETKLINLLEPSETGNFAKTR